MKYVRLIAVLFALLLIVSYFSLGGDKKFSDRAMVASPFLYSFNNPGILHEAGSMTESSSPYWWLNSGGVMSIDEMSGATNQGELDKLSRWRLLYRINNPTDTDQGYHPQNIFRLISRSKWQDLREEVFFKINADNLSTSPNRNASNGLLLMMRYQDHNNLYYAGLRVDGTAVIKKKIGGDYVTLGRAPITAGDYDRVSSPNLLPKDVWIGVRSEVINSGTDVIVRLFAKIGDEDWKKVLETIDKPSLVSGATIQNEGYIGIRTDFMDVEFRDFKVENLEATLADR